jgi:hypothetical protein
MQKNLFQDAYDISYDQAYKEHFDLMASQKVRRVSRTIPTRNRVSVKELENDSSLAQAFMDSINLSIKSGDYSKFVTLHSLYMYEIHTFRGSAHTNERFLPWHRVYLLKFEDMLNTLYKKDHPDSNINISIPYWDWENDRQIPSLFANFDIALDVEVYLYDLEARPLGSQTFNLPVKRYTAPDLSDRLPIANQIRSIKDQDTFMRFSGALETRPHNSVHGLIGGQNPFPNPDLPFDTYGTMGDPYISPLDILFWTHHSNIDRIWASWQKEKFDEGITEYVNPNLHGEEAQMHPWFPEFDEINTRDIIELGYTYRRL